MRTLVVIPTYEERGTLIELLTALRRLPAAPEILVVDDASPDGTGALADEFADRDPHVHVLHRERKAGLGPAYRAGLQWGLERGHTALVEMDADLSHDPGQVPLLIEGLAGADVVIGSRYVDGGDVQQWAPGRIALSTWGNRYVRGVTRLPIQDATSGFRAFRAAVLRTICVETLTSDGYAFQVETAFRAWRAGFTIREVPITFVERREGASKLSRRVVAEAAWRVPVWGLASLLGPRPPGRGHPSSVSRAGADDASPPSPPTR